MTRVMEQTHRLPQWVGGLFGGFDAASVLPTAAVAENPFDLSTWQYREAGGWKLIAGRISNASSLSDVQLRHATRSLYEAFSSQVQDQWQPVRCWNFIPEINRKIAGGLDRYMMFNAGRHEALKHGFGPNASFEAMPTATAVGHQRRDLEAFCLASSGSATPIENPGQTPAYRYSERYGPLPPCFSRATLVTEEDGCRALLIGGTASVAGEETRHHDCLVSQLSETLLNLEQVVATASDGQAKLAQCSRDIRVYYRDADDLPALERQVRPWFNGLDSFELVQASICRPELLVEIEAFCSLSDV